MHGHSLHNLANLVAQVAGWHLSQKLLDHTVEHHAMLQEDVGAGEQILRGAQAAFTSREQVYLKGHLAHELGDLHDLVLRLVPLVRLGLDLLLEQLHLEAELGHPGLFGRVQAARLRV